MTSGLRTGLAEGLAPFQKLWEINSNYVRRLALDPDPGRPNSQEGGRE